NLGRTNARPGGPIQAGPSICAERGPEPDPTKSTHAPGRDSTCLSADSTERGSEAGPTDPGVRPKACTCGKGVVRDPQCIEPQGNACPSRVGYALSAAAPVPGSQ